MMHFMTRWALQMDIFLDCFEDYLEDFYSKFGFSVIGRKAEWAHGDPELRTSMQCKSWTSQNHELKQCVDDIFRKHTLGTLLEC